MVTLDYHDIIDGPTMAVSILTNRQGAIGHIPRDKIRSVGEYLRQKEIEPVDSYAERVSILHPHISETPKLFAIFHPIYLIKALTARRRIEKKLRKTKTNVAYVQIGHFGLCADFFRLDNLEGILATANNLSNHNS